MMYRKFRADLLFDGDRFLTNGEVLITNHDGRIVEIVNDSEMADVEQFTGVLCPGLVNTHCHLELSWMKGRIPEGVGMIDFLLAVMQMPRVSPGEVSQAMRSAEDAMLRSGIIAVGDICNTTLTLGLKKEANLYYFNFIEALGFVEAYAEQRFQQALKVYSEFAEQYPLPVQCNSIVPHAPYSVSQALFERITAFPGNRVLSIHNQECAAENEFFMNGTGDFHRLYQQLGVDTAFHKPAVKSSLEHVLRWFRRNQSVILVHNVDTGEPDLKLIKGAQENGINCWLCLCPNANQYINQRLPDVSLIMKESGNIVIGTDSLASNHELNIVSELKTIHDNFPGVAIEDMLRWATSNGAKALDIYDEAGSFESGKQPGIVLLEGFSADHISVKASSTRIL